MAQLNAGKRKELLTLREHLSSPRVVLFWVFVFVFVFLGGFFGGGSVLLICLVFCVVLLCVFMFWVPCCDVRYDFRIKTMFGYLCLFAYSGVQHILCCFIFLRVMYPVLPVSLDCPFLAHLAKGNVSFCHHLASVVRRLSFVNFSHFNLLLWNPSAKWTETW